MAKQAEAGEDRKTKVIHSQFQVHLYQAFVLDIWKQNSSPKNSKLKENPEKTQKPATPVELNWC